MNKGFLTAFLVVAAAFAAKADLLYWQINETDNIQWLEQRNNVEGGYVYASIYQKDGESAVMLNSVGPNSALAGDTVTIGSLVAAELVGDYSSSSFFIELYDSSFEKVATSDVVAYDSTLFGNYISAAAFNENWTDANGAFGTSMGLQFIPEPTSGLLLLIGAAVLGLKRKRV